VGVARWKVILAFALGWTVLVGLGEAMFYYLYAQQGDERACYACAFDHARIMQTPGPWNSGQPWTAEQGHAYRQPYDRLQQQQAWRYSRPYLLIAAALLLGGCGLLARVEFHPGDGGGTSPPRQQ
jgi:hypothetical protein